LDLYRRRCSTLQLRQLGIHIDPMGGGLPIKVSRGNSPTISS